MNLKAICMTKLVEHINNLPPLIKDEVIGESAKTIKKESVNNIQKYTGVIDDITDIIIDSKRTGKDWQRPYYTYEIDDDIYNLLVIIAENFVTKYYNEIVLFGTKRRRDQEESEDEDEDEDDY